jgi:formate hydrogenlyase subunit 4
MSQALSIAAHVLVCLLFPPLLLGLIVKVKAFFGGRSGAPVLQPYFDLLRLVRKGSVFSRTTTWVFQAGPVVSLVALGLAALLMPLGGHPAPLSFGGDVVLFAYLLALGRFFTIAAALDTGSSFEGMGAAREAAFSALAEPGLFLGLMVLVRKAGEASLTAMLAPEAVQRAWGGTGGALVLVAVSFAVVLLVENSRVPVDDPTTHLELTMIHEVMVLDHSGPGLAAILYGAALKLFLLGALVASVVYPYSTGNVWADWGLFLVAMSGLALGIGVLESIMARLRLLHVPRLLVAASVLSLFGIILSR